MWGLFKKSLSVVKFAPDGVELVRRVMFIPRERFYLRKGDFEYRNVGNPRRNFSRRLTKNDVFVLTDGIIVGEHGSPGGTPFFAIQFAEPELGTYVFMNFPDPKGVNPEGFDLGRPTLILKSMGSFAGIRTEDRT